MNKEKISLILKIIFYISFGIFAMFLFPLIACHYSNSSSDYCGDIEVQDIELITTIAYCISLVDFLIFLILEFMGVDIFDNKRKMESDE